MDTDPLNDILFPPSIGADAIPVARRGTLTATCDDCHELLTDPLGRAHPHLQITGAKKEASGLSSGLIFRYRCAACGFTWRRAAASTSTRHVWLGGAPGVHSATPTVATAGPASP